MEMNKLLNLLLMFTLFSLLTMNLVSADANQGQKDNPDSELDGVYDIAATGEYDGYRKLIGHKLEKFYDIYFQYQGDGSKFSYQIKTVS